VRPHAVIVRLVIAVQFIRPAERGPDTDPMYRVLSGVRAILIL